MPYRSPFPAFELPLIDLPGLFYDSRKSNSKYSTPFPHDQVITTLAETGESLTYDQIRELSVSFARGLKSKIGLKRGDAICVYSTNHIYWYPLLVGTWYAGMTVTPANSAYNVTELTYQLKLSKAKAIVTEKNTLKDAVAAAKNVGIDDKCILIVEEATGDYKCWKDILVKDETIALVKNDPNSLALLCFSSGTTGLPKAVMLSHRNVVAAVMMFADVNGRYLTHHDVFCGVLPFYHIGGLSFTLLLSIYMGLKVVVMRRFDLEKWLEVVQKYGVTYAHVAPPIMVLLAKDPIVDKYDLRSLRVINSSAAPLKEDLLLATHKRLNIPVQQGYGMTETAPMGTSPLWEDWKLVGNSGRVGALMEYKIIDAEGNEIPRDQPGELCLRGPNIMLGYLDNPKATKESFTEDGFLRTGDIGYFGENENLWLTDRVKDLIKVKGYQVAPAELEDTLMNHPAIIDVGVSRISTLYPANIGYWSNEESTEFPRAFVVLGKGYTPSTKVEKDICEWLAKKVVHYKQLRGGVVFVEKIPKTASGKILRRQLKDVPALQKEDIKARL